MRPPTVFQALSRGAAAVSRTGWLAAVGLLVSGLRSALLLPAQIFAFVMLQLAAASWIARQGGIPLPGAAARGIEATLSSPRFLSIAAGLWVAAVLLAAALRLAYLAGALPTLGAALAGEVPSGRFAPGFVHGFTALLPTAVVAFVAELLTSLTVLALLAAIAFSAGSLSSSEGGLIVPLLTAAALAGALLLVAAVSAICDAALCRAALRGEATGHAFGRAAIRFGQRPAAFLVIGITAAVLGTVLSGSSDALAAAGTGAAAGRLSPWLAVGPQLMSAAAAALVAAAVELWRFGATAVLACHAAARP